MANKGDVIIVLGAAPAPDGSPSPAMARRVARGVEAFRDGHAPWVLVTGGPVRHSEPEADIMARLAVSHGVPGERIIREPIAANTFENAVFSAAVMAERGWEHAVVVTDRFHLPRALYVFRRLSIPATGLAVEGRGGEPLWRWSAAWLREGAAFARSAALFALGRHKPIVARVLGR